MTRKSKTNQGKKTKPKPRHKEMTEMPSPSDFSHCDYEPLKSESESSEDDISEQGRRLKVYIYKSELAKIKNWALLHPNIETGGDLFGLWMNSHTAVVQFALGPGEKCKRYETAFFQDLQYLANAGSYLTEKHGLCNLGQWHSHHQLSLNKPSSGDENTVWGHMPTLGLSRYIVCIANISKRRNTYNASLNCFLFELNDRGKQLPVVRGTFHHVNQASPVNEHSEIAQVIAQGAESIVEPVCDSDGENSTHTESCRFQCKCLVRRFTSWICSASGKGWTFLGLVTVLLIVVATVSLIKSMNDEPTQPRPQDHLWTRLEPTVDEPNY